MSIFDNIVFDEFTLLDEGMTKQEYMEKRHKDYSDNHNKELDRDKRRYKDDLSKTSSYRKIDSEIRDREEEFHKKGIYSKYPKANELNMNDMLDGYKRHMRRHSK